MKRKLKKEVKYGLYALGFIAIVGLVYSIERTLFPITFRDKDPYQYVSETILDEVVPVIANIDIARRPYNDSNVTIVKNFYNYLSTNEEQEKSLIYNENTYLPSTGIGYSSGSVFDVIAILDGTVTDVKDDELLGKVIEIRHANDVISVYQSLSEVNIKVNDVIKKDDIIGKSGVANISKDLGNHLYFELIVGGVSVNPEEYYDKKITEF